MRKWKIVTKMFLSQNICYILCFILWLYMKGPLSSAACAWCWLTRGELMCRHRLPTCPGENESTIRNLAKFASLENVLWNQEKKKTELELDSFSTVKTSRVMWAEWESMRLLQTLPVDRRAKQRAQEVTFTEWTIFYMLKMSFRKAQKGVCMQSTCN